MHRMGRKIAWTMEGVKGGNRVKPSDILKPMTFSCTNQNFTVKDVSTKFGCI